MRLLVTGGAGFIGSNFVHYWLGRHPDDHVVVYDLLTYAGNRESLAPVEERIVFVEGDICDRDLAEAALRENDVDTVVNFAAESHNSLAVVDPTRFFRTNVLGTQTLLDASRAAGVERFHHVSTCEVYGDLDLDTDEVFTEESPYRPRTPYNASKAGADHAVRAYFETFELPITITNCSNNYGPFQFPEKVIPLFTTNAIDDEPLPMYASTQNKREWLHVLDHCEAIDLVLHEGRPGETYNVGSGIEATIEEIADRVLELTGKPASLKKIVPDRPGHDRRYLLDATKIREELGWTAVTRLRRGARRDRRLVRGEPRLVGAAEGSRAGRRICLEIADFAQGRARSAENWSTELGSDRSLTPAQFPYHCGATLVPFVRPLLVALRHRSRRLATASASGQQVPPHPTARRPSSSRVGGMDTVSG